MIGTSGGAANALSHRDLYALSKITMQGRSKPSRRRRAATPTKKLAIAPSGCDSYRGIPSRGNVK
jgi:hypothetical protein